MEDEGWRMEDKCVITWYNIRRFEEIRKNRKKFVEIRRNPEKPGEI